MSKKEDELREKIYHLKESFQEYLERSLDLRDMGIYFLWNQERRITASYEHELEKFRKELCDERGE